MKRVLFITVLHPSLGNTNTFTKSSPCVIELHTDKQLSLVSMMPNDFPVNQLVITTMSVDPAKDLKKIA